MFSHFISYIETHEFFQIELLLLLASLLLSLFFSNTLPYFVASAICVLATTTSLIFELFSDLSGQYAYLEATTTLTISLLLSGTFAYTLINRVSNVELRWHTITILAFWSYLALRAVWILEDTTRLSQPQLDEQNLEAAGFAALHLMSTILMLNDRSTTSQPPLTVEFDEKHMGSV